MELAWKHRIAFFPSHRFGPFLFPPITLLLLLPRTLYNHEHDPRIGHSNKHAIIVKAMRTDSDQIYSSQPSSSITTAKAHSSPKSFDVDKVETETATHAFMRRVNYKVPEVDKPPREVRAWDLSMC